MAIQRFMGSLYLSKFIWEVDVLKETKSEKNYAVASRINPEFELNKNYQMKGICLKLLPIIFCLLFVQQGIGKTLPHCERLDQEIKFDNEKAKEL